MKTIYIALLGVLLCMPTALALEAELLNTDPYPLKAGEKGDIRVKVFDYAAPESSSEEAGLQDVQVRFMDSEVLTLLDETKRELSFTIQDRHSPEFFQMIDYPVHIPREAPNGSVPLKIELESHNTKKETVTLQIPITRDTTNLTLGSIESNPENLYPDTEDIRIDMQVSNIGELKAQEAVIQLASEALEPSSSFAMRYALGTIEEGESKEAKFHADLPKDVSKGTHTLQVNVAYTEEEADTLKEEQFSVPFTVLGEPSFSLTTLHNNATKQGKEGYMRLGLKNTGSEEAERVAVDVVKNSETQIEFESYTDFVGDLKAQQDGEIYLPYSVKKEAAPKDHQVVLSIRYLFNDKVHTEEMRRTLTVTEQQQSLMQNKSFIAIAIAAVMVIAVIVKAATSSVRTSQE